MVCDKPFQFASTLTHTEAVTKSLPRHHAVPMCGVPSRKETGLPGRRVEVVMGKDQLFQIDLTKKNKGSKKHPTYIENATCTLDLVQKQMLTRFINIVTVAVGSPEILKSCTRRRAKTQSSIWICSASFGPWSYNQKLNTNIV
jgi:hypothetical protein